MRKNGKKRAKISIMIPTIGRIVSLTNCLRSLLYQTHLPDEIIVINNGKKNESVKRLVNNLDPTNTRIKYAFEPRQGVCYARNTAIERTNNDLVAFIDDDCIAHKRWVEEIILFDRANSNVIVRGKNLNGDYNNLYTCLDHFTSELHFQLESISLLNTKNCSFRKSILPKGFSFDTNFSFMCEDIDFGLRANQMGIKIVLNQKMIVKHFGRNTLFSHLKRDFEKGVGRFQISKKWKDNSAKTVNFMRVKRQISISKKLKKQVLKNKSILFQIMFNYFLSFDPYVVKFGYWWKSKFSTLLSQNMS
jgi:glycosyltransferase involved in cell wall biosynthesis